VAVNSTTDTLKNSMLKERTDRAWFSRLYDIRPGNEAGLTTPEPASLTHEDTEAVYVSQLRRLIMTSTCASLVSLDAIFHPSCYTRRAATETALASSEA